MGPSSHSVSLAHPVTGGGEDNRKRKGTGSHWGDDRDKDYVLIRPALGQQLHPRGDDSAGDASSPKGWSHRLWPSSPTGARDTHRGGPSSDVWNRPSARRPGHPRSLHTPAEAEAPGQAE